MEIRCPHCTATLDVEDFSAGRLTICPACSGTFRIEPTVTSARSSPGETPPSGKSLADSGPVGTVTPPWGLSRAAETWLRREPGNRLIHCPACDRTLSVDRSMTGQTMICPTCGNRLQIPARSPAGDPALDPSGPQAVVLKPDPPRPRTPLPPLRERTFEREPPSPAWSQPPWDTPLETDLPAIRETPAPPNPYRLPALFLMILSGFGLTVMLPMVGAQFLSALFGQTSGLPFGLSLVAATAHALTFYGGMQMHSRQSLKMAKLGAWAGLYPLSFCCLFPAPFAIWALIRLSDPQAESEFDEP